MYYYNIMNAKETNSSLKFRHDFEIFIMKLVSKATIASHSIWKLPSQPLATAL